MTQKKRIVASKFPRFTIKLVPHICNALSIKLPQTFPELQSVVPQYMIWCMARSYNCLKISKSCNQICPKSSFMDVFYCSTLIGPGLGKRGTRITWKYMKKTQPSLRFRNWQDVFCWTNPGVDILQFKAQKCLTRWKSYEAKFAKQTQCNIQLYMLAKA